MRTCVSKGVRFAVSEHELPLCLVRLPLWDLLLANRLPKHACVPIGTSDCAMDGSIHANQQFLVNATEMAIRFSSPFGNRMYGWVHGDPHIGFHTQGQPAPCIPALHAEVHTYTHAVTLAGHRPEPPRCRQRIRLICCQTSTVALSHTHTPPLTPQQKPSIVVNPPNFRNWRSFIVGASTLRTRHMW